MKMLKLSMAALVLMTATQMQAQVKAGGKGSSAAPVEAETPTRTKTGMNATTTQQQTEVTSEPVLDVDKLTTADQVRQFADQKVAWLETQVGTLSDAQKKSIRDNFTQAYGEIKKVKEANPEMPKAELKTKAEPMIATARSKSIEVLTPEQQEKLGTWQSGRQNTAMEGAQKRALEQTEQLDKVVGLSADQKQQVLDLNTKLWMEGRDWKAANPNVTAEEKKAYAKDMSLKRVEGYKTILTEDQKTKLMEYRKSAGATDMD